MIWASGDQIEQAEEEDYSFHNNEDSDDGSKQPQLFQQQDDDSEEPQPFQPQDNEDEDIDADVPHAHAPSTAAEKKRAENEILKSYAAKRTAEITQEEVAESLRGTKDEKLSVRDILARQETSAQIINPRDYQTELFQKARDRNVIAVLDTGTGKTHIATLLLRHILDQELETRSKGGTHKTAFFLVDSVNLVFQQANVLRCGLAHKVEGICGAMGASLWAKPTWDKHFAQNMVIVCTAEVLVQCMMHSFISMSRVNLLIFDEAHHAKNNHPYARLLKDYYYTEKDRSKRPRIFGMTASPVDANQNIRQAASDLETLLDSKIATTSDSTLSSNNITKPEEHVDRYDPLQPGFETPLHQEVKSRFGDISTFEKFFRMSKLISSELGRWASDKYWSFAFSEEESKKIEMRQERLHNKTKEHSVEKFNKDIAKLREAAEFIRKQESGPPTVTPYDLSSKVLDLHKWLQKYYERTGDSRCIVFVEQRQTARLLKLIFTHIGGPHLLPEMLVGINSRVGELNVSLHAQVMTVAKFRRGELNCLFSTSVGEEGLDIPQCNLVVRFDLYRTMIAYVQSRGRARHKHSKYLHMAEKDNFNHARMIYNARSQENIMREFCGGLRHEQLLNEAETDDASDMFAETTYRTYTDPASGAKLTYRSSLSVLAHFVSSLPGQNRELAAPAHYVVDYQGSMFRAEVILPEFSPIVSAMGLPCGRKAMAKCSAAFEMCLELRQNNYLDENLLPIYTKTLPAMRNALLAISSKKKDLYDMQLKPKFWDLGFDTIPERLYLTVLDVSNGLERPHQPIGLITREPFPQMPRFPIYTRDGLSSDVMTTPLTTAIEVSEDILKLFTQLTLQIYQDVFAKKFELDLPKMTYWLIPIKSGISAPVTTSDNPNDLMDWAQIHEVCEKDEYIWNREMTADFLADKYIVDKWDGGRRFYSIGVAPQYKPHDPVPKSVPKHKYMADILDYSVSLWSKQRATRVWDPSQPVMEVEKIPFRRNLLATVEKDETEVITVPRAFVCPEPLRISALTTRFVAMCYVFPAIIHRFESYLIALDACQCLGLNVGPQLALEALTKDSENSDEHGEEKINLKSGMGPNYERLEFMGDCFLKMATSISTFVLQPDENEFEYHVRRMVMLCNKNLLDTAMKYKLYEYVRTMAFSRRTWYPEGLKLLFGKGHKRTGPQVIKHSLGDKSIADVCEAFIGATFMQHNERGTWNAKSWDESVKAVKIMVDSEDHLMEKWSDYYAAYQIPKYQVAEATASQYDLAKQIEEKHPYHFKWPRLLRSAFMHPSQAFMYEHVPNYQRLEFLGDSLLDQVFIQYLFYRFPNKDPQWLTEHKMPMVSNKFLATVCVKLGFHPHIRQNNSKLSSDIRDYVVDIQEAEREAESKDYWAHVSTEPPKCLADVVEAYVGAMFVDSEFDFSVVQKFFDMHIKSFYEDMALYDDFANNHPVTRLARLFERNFGCKEWRLATRERKSIIPGARSDVIAMILIHFKVHFDGVAVSGRYARPKACKLAYEKLEGLAPFEFRREYGCDCEQEPTEEEKETKEEAEARIKEAMGTNL
ncbi:dicer-like protein 1 [Pleomassaria siparia CBS 279.74]|uniref:Dicer-like protein 1 n=1 Tax=Pleomassaria siparia CBS 279.74 TaxID=1314801 RepID=A0A6G1JS71_9PLEO|nr:dicer-like protein 1 [Pleomassaria siparia CBS 279.74]